MVSAHRSSRPDHRQLRVPLCESGGTNAWADAGNDGTDDRGSPASPTAQPTTSSSRPSAPPALPARRYRQPRPHPRPCPTRPRSQPGRLRASFSLGPRPATTAAPPSAPIASSARTTTPPGPLGGPFPGSTLTYRDSGLDQGDRVHLPHLRHQRRRRQRLDLGLRASPWPTSPQVPSVPQSVTATAGSGKVDLELE